MYRIKDYSYEKAQELGLDIYPSKRKHKKIDVYKNGDYLTSIGDNRYKDFPTFLEEEGEEVANKKRLLYRKRHKKDLGYFKGFLATHILW
jgi:uncharacterized protein YaaR (DUF327 family)